MDWSKLEYDFHEEISDATKYAGMAKDASGCQRQMLKDMAWDEVSHAKHIEWMMEEHGNSVEKHKEKLDAVMHMLKEL